MNPTDNFAWECTACGHILHEYQDPKVPDTPTTKTCPQCGGEMKGDFHIKPRPAPFCTTVIFE